MLFPERRLAVALLLAAASTLCLPAGAVRAEGCSQHQASSSFQPPMSPMPAMQCQASMRMSQCQGMRMGPPAPSMSQSSLMSTLRPMMCMSQSGMSRPGPMPFPMMPTSLSQPVLQQPVWQQLQWVALQQQLLVREQQRVALQRQQRQQEKLQRIDQLKAIQALMTTLQQQLNTLDRPAAGNAVQAPQLNELQHQVHALQAQLSGVVKPPSALVQQMSDLQDQMSSLQQRVTAKPADLIAELQQRLK